MDDFYLLFILILNKYLYIRSKIHTYLLGKNKLSSNRNVLRVFPRIHTFSVVIIIFVCVFGFVEKLCLYSLLSLMNRKNIVLYL